MSLHRRAARKDDNHAAVVEVLRNSGCSVQPLNAPGAPDLVVGLNGTNHLVEVKRPLGAKGGRSHRDLNPLQRAWHGAWRGEPPWVLRSPADALEWVQARLYEPEVD